MAALGVAGGRAQGLSEAAPAPKTVNVAPTNGIATADVFKDQSMAPSKAIDGDPSTMWNAGSRGTATHPHFLIVKLRRPLRVGAISLKDIVWKPGGPFLGFDNIYNLYIGSDGVSYTKIASGTLTESRDPKWNSALVKVPKPLSTLQYVKYEVVGGSHWAHLVEMEILVSQELNPRR